MIARLGGIAEAFADANFRRYSVGSIVSWLSFFVQAVAISWTTWSLTHSTRRLAAVALLDAVPMGLIAPLGGAVADRHDRFRVLIAAYAVATLHALALMLLSLNGALTVERLAALAVLHGVAHAFSVPANYGLLPRFVAPPRLASAIAVSAAYTQLGLFLGPALAGWVILRFGVTAAFAGNVAGYLVFFLAASRLRTPEGYEPPKRPTQSLRRDVSAGLAWAWSHPGVRGLLILTLFGDALISGVRQMLPALSDRRFGAGVEAFSSLLTCGGIGATLAALWLAQGGGRRLTTRLALTAFLAHAASTAALALSSALAFAAPAMLARGAAAEISRTGVVALLQTRVPDAMRGRVLGAHFFLSQGAGALGVGLIGASAETFGLVAPLLAGCALASAVGLALWRQATHLPDPAPPAPPSAAR